VCQANSLQTSFVTYVSSE